jgi:hypothetical protein
MQKIKVGVPIGSGVGTEPLRMIFGETQIIGESRIQERKCAVRQSVKGMRWKDIECGL